MKIEFEYTLKQPLSHIGESEGTTTFLNTIRVLSEGKVQEVFAYTGNAIRGTLRDCAARYLLNLLGVKVDKERFNILFSGGNISGAQTVDIDQAKKYRQLLPMISVFGAGVGNQILAGKMTMGFALPVCRETKEILPDDVQMKETDKAGTSWRQMTGTVSFTRMDDSKDVNLRRYMAGEPEEKKKKETEAATQMRYEVEYLCPGSILYHEITVAEDATLVEIGVLITALEEFAKDPVLGGMSGKGFGLCDVAANVRLEGDKWMDISNGKFLAGAYFENAAEMYTKQITENADAIIDFLGGVPLEQENHKAAEGDLQTV